MIKPFTSRKFRSWFALSIAFALYTLILLFLAFITPSEASESVKKISEGYHGPERFKTVETPVTPNSGVTVERGWIGDKRINLRHYPTQNGTVTRGWVGKEYRSIRETVKSPPKEQ